MPRKRSRKTATTGGPVPNPDPVPVPVPEDPYKQMYARIMFYIGTQRSFCDCIEDARNYLNANPSSYLPVQELYEQVVMIVGSFSAFHQFYEPHNIDTMHNFLVLKEGYGVVDVPLKYGPGRTAAEARLKKLNETNTEEVGTSDEFLFSRWKDMKEEALKMRETRAMHGLIQTMGRCRQIKQLVPITRAWLATHVQSLYFATVNQFPGFSEREYKELNRVAELMLKDKGRHWGDEWVAEIKRRAGLELVWTTVDDAIEGLQEDLIKIKPEPEEEASQAGIKKEEDRDGQVETKKEEDGDAVMEDA